MVMEAFFICKKCEKLVATEKTEDHSVQCYDKDTQKKKFSQLYYGNMDRDEKDIIVAL